MSSSKRDLHRFERSVYGGYGDGNTSESIKGISNFNLWNEVSMVVSVIAKIRTEWFRVITRFEVIVMYIKHQLVSLVSWLVTFVKIRRDSDYLILRRFILIYILHFIG